MAQWSSRLRSGAGQGEESHPAFPAFLPTLCWIWQDFVSGTQGKHGFHLTFGYV